MVTERNGKRIGGIIVFWFYLKGKIVLQHFPDLFFVGITIAGNGLFYFFWGVFSYRKPMRHGSGDGYPLRSTKLQHTLYILSEKRSLNSQFIRMVRLYDCSYFQMDLV